MRKRHAIPALVLLAAFAGLLAYLARPDPPAPGVTWANAARIQVRMTEAEVVAIVGTPPRGTLQYHGPDTFDEPELPDAAWMQLWSGSERDIIVFIDRNCRVVAVRVHGLPPPTWFDRLRRRLGL